MKKSAAPEITSAIMAYVATKILTDSTAAHRTKVAAQNIAANIRFPPSVVFLGLALGLCSGLLNGCASSESAPGPQTSGTAPASVKAPSPQRTETTFQLALAALDGRNEKPILHFGKGPLKNWVALTLPEEPLTELRAQLRTVVGPFADRGESHITVITPLEYDEALRARVSIKELDELADKMELQKSAVQARCVGRGQAQIDGKAEQTYFVAVMAPALLRYRQAVEHLFQSRGGRANEFSADHFYPHITIGFTKRDLFEADGVIKDTNSCFANLQLHQ